jgi:hypothetical protein
MQVRVLNSVLCGAGAILTGWPDGFLGAPATVRR